MLASVDLLTAFDVLLFDFDGLLVDTERLQYQAYVQMFAARGCVLPWSFERYCQAAHYGAGQMREAAYTLFPRLREEAPSWDVLYREKKAQYRALLSQAEVRLMPGVAALLERLMAFSGSSCVVTNSPKEVVDVICSRLPLLRVISRWITREEYDRPKPAPDAYLLALRECARPGDRVVGFEDTVRGLKALVAAVEEAPSSFQAQAVLVNAEGVAGVECVQGCTQVPIEVWSSF